MINSWLICCQLQFYLFVHVFIYQTYPATLSTVSFLIFFFFSFFIPSFIIVRIFNYIFSQSYPKIHQSSFPSISSPLCTFLNIFEWVWRKVKIITLLLISFLLYFTGLRENHFKFVFIFSIWINELQKLGIFYPCLLRNLTELN